MVAAVDLVVAAGRLVVADDVHLVVACGGESANDVQCFCSTHAVVAGGDC